MNKVVEEFDNKTAKDNPIKPKDPPSTTMKSNKLPIFTINSKPILVDSFAINFE